MSDTTNSAERSGDSAKRERVAVGKIVSDGMDKTIVVLIERRTQHPLYGKYIRRSTRLKAHDPENKGRVGDWVEIREGRPASRGKSWWLQRVVENAGEFDTAG